MITSRGPQLDPWRAKTVEDEICNLIDMGFTPKELMDQYDMTLKKISHIYTGRDKLRKPKKKMPGNNVDETVHSEIIIEGNRSIARCYECIWTSQRWSTKPDAEEALTLHNLREH